MKAAPQTPKHLNNSDLNEHIELHFLTLCLSFSKSLSNSLKWQKTHLQKNQHGGCFTGYLIKRVWQVLMLTSTSVVIQKKKKKG